MVFRDKYNIKIKFFVIVIRGFLVNVESIS